MTSTEITPPTKKKGAGVLLVIAGIIAIWTGLTPNEDHTQSAIHEGETVIVSCDKDEPISGPVLALAVREACEDGWADRQAQRPLWLGGGAIAAVSGVVLIRSVTLRP